MHDTHSPENPRAKSYREEAERLRAGAAAADNPQTRRNLLEAAIVLEGLADMIERKKG